ncbi:hypothetical protein ISN44_As13g013520 [Arabidopsis suecica]|uniref:Uncharacterized protein n=1 Tax=Arabidopsis suecica TaxID=45249 RepID=A0A8T1XY21_ARASU|nr:hypothetical protein ISN44_As13g013520 [Arabidopsis suecica]
MDKEITEAQRIFSFLYCLLRPKIPSNLMVLAGKPQLEPEFLPLPSSQLYCCSASMAVSKVPNQTRTPFLFGSLISAAYLPHGLRLTPL